MWRADGHTERAAYGSFVRGAAAVGDNAEGLRLVRLQLK